MRAVATVVLGPLLALSMGPVPADAAAGTDPLRPRQWALDQIGASAAWKVSTGTGVKIGIVDTGVAAGHEDLAGKVVAQADCVGSAGEHDRCGGSATDDHGHGTHVAAIAAASVGNGKGIAGVAPGAELVVAKALVPDSDHGASGSVRDVVAAIRWVVDNGARVVNLSLGSEVADTKPGVLELAAGIGYAWERGAVAVLAVGNENESAPQAVDYSALPAILVGATDRDGRVALYSNSLAGPRWGVVAPGGGAIANDDRSDANRTANIVSAWSVPGRNDAYATAAGTSMAAPHVSAGIALLLAKGLSRDEAISRLLTSADSIDCGSRCSGRLNLASALGEPATTVPDSQTAPRVSQEASEEVAVVAAEPPRPAIQPAPITSTPPLRQPVSPPTTLARPAPPRPEAPGVIENSVPGLIPPTSLLVDVSESASGNRGEDESAFEVPEPEILDDHDLTLAAAPSLSSRSGRRPGDESEGGDFPWIPALVTGLALMATFGGYSLTRRALARADRAQGQSGRLLG